MLDMPSKLFNSNVCRREHAFPDALLVPLLTQPQAIIHAHVSDAFL